MNEERARRAFLVHGNAGAATLWTRVLAALGDAVTPCAVDLPGFGANAGSLAGDPVDVIETAVEQMWHAAKASDTAFAGPVVLAGNGIGAVLCARAALRLGPSVRGVVMTGPVGLRGGHERLGVLSRARTGAALLRLAGRTVGRARFLRDQLADPDGDPGACEVLLDALRRARGFHLLARLNRPGSLAGLRDLKCPVTVLWGDRDGVLPVTRAAEFMTHLPPHARLEIVPGAAHALPLERPDVVARAIAELA